MKCRDRKCPHCNVWAQPLQLVYAMACYGAGGLVLLALVALFGGCAFESRVRRAESLTDVAVVVDEHGASGWRLVAVTPQHDAFVLVFERRARP